MTFLRSFAALLVQGRVHVQHLPPFSSILQRLPPLPPPAGAAIHGHLAALLPPLLTLASSHPDVSPQAAAAHQAVAAVALSVQVGSPCAPGCAQAGPACRSWNRHVLFVLSQQSCARAFNQSAPASVVAVQEDGLYLLMQELQRGLEEPARRRGAATVTALFCRTSKLDFQEHVPALITVRMCCLSLVGLALLILWGCKPSWASSSITVSGSGFAVSMRWLPVGESPQLCLRVLESASSLKSRTSKLTPEGSMCRASL